MSFTSTHSVTGMTCGHRAGSATGELSRHEVGAAVTEAGHRPA
ncbi:hypothetical protein [Saccharothrix syringae]|nr:hypothetical protein [Saccharothrix syringae]